MLGALLAGNVPDIFSTHIVDIVGQHKRVACGLIPESTLWTRFSAQRDIQWPSEEVTVFMKSDVKSSMTKDWIRRHGKMEDDVMRRIGVGWHLVAVQGSAASSCGQLSWYLNLVFRCSLKIVYMLFEGGSRVQRMSFACPLRTVSMFFEYGKRMLLARMLLAHSLKICRMLNTVLSWSWKMVSMFREYVECFSGLLLCSFKILSVLFEDYYPDFFFLRPVACLHISQ